MGGENEEEIIYTLADGKDIKLGKELFKCTDLLFNQGYNKELRSIDEIVLSSLSKWDPVY